jgi:hypothetical protein
MEQNKKIRKFLAGKEGNTGRGESNNPTHMTDSDSCFKRLRSFIRVEVIEQEQSN